ncbi:hypothetical protein V8E51_015654 [Hyaloscypha variabilis]
MDTKKVPEQVVPHAAVLDLEAQGTQVLDATQKLSPPAPTPPIELSTDETPFVPGRGSPTGLHNLRDGNRYDPQWNRPPFKEAGVEFSVLDSLHHANMDNLRSRLLTSTFISNHAKEFIKRVEDIPQAEKGYHDWRGLSQEERSSKNKSIYPEESDLLITKAIVLLECATIDDLDEEKVTLASTRKKLHGIVQNRQADVERSIVRGTQQSLVSRTFIESVKAREQFISRASAAVFRGLAVIVPMLIMSLHPTRLTQLLTASVFVVSIVLILAWLMDEAERKDIIAATAAYGAVLVVFFRGLFQLDLQTTFLSGKSSYNGDSLSLDRTIVDQQDGVDSGRRIVEPPNNTYTRSEASLTPSPFSLNKRGLTCGRLGDHIRMTAVCSR